MPPPDHILAPKVLTVTFRVEAVTNAYESLLLLNQAESLSGLAQWVTQTFHALSPEQRWHNELVFEGFDILFEGEYAPQQSKGHTFADFIQQFASADSFALRDHYIQRVLKIKPKDADAEATLPPAPSADVLLASREAFLNFLVSRWPHCSDEIAVFEAVHDFLQDPPAMQHLIVTHLQEMWDGWLEAEWARTRPMIEECVAAFQQLDFPQQDIFEAIRVVTGRDARAISKWGATLSQVSELIFVPSPHIGPYLSIFGEADTRYVFFGARQPRGIQRQSSALSRSELLVRLNALADDTRLRILELLTEHEELCAQEIIERLDLSQSTVSRHLSQLSATGYITERRKEVQKCYSLNPDRVVDTLRALTNFLSRA